MPSLSAYRNVFGAAHEALRRKGFQVWKDGELFWCEKDGWDFCADDPMQLLGLVSLFELVAPEQYEEYWWRLAYEHEIPTAPQPYESVIFRKRSPSERDPEGA